jgi:hypothetical protein
MNVHLLPRIKPKMKFLENVVILPILLLLVVVVVLG